MAPGSSPSSGGPDSTCGPSSPLVDHFELDAFGLDGPSEATVAAVDAKLELLLELCQRKEGERRGRREREGAGSAYGLMGFLRGGEAGGCFLPGLTRGVCVFDHAGLVFLSFFL